MADARAQTSPVATVLLIGIVLATATTIVVFGGGFFDSLSNTADTERATQEMSHLAAESAAVALGGSRQRRVDFDASEGKLTLNETASWICVENGSTSDREFLLPEDGNASASCGENRTYMGTMTYDTGDGRVAYEGGGVWTRGDEGESRMVSPPEFHYREETLTLPVVVLEGNVTRAGSETELTARDGETDRVDGISNPLDDSSGRVYVTIRSEYCEAWRKFMTDRTDARVVEFCNDNEMVTVELVVPSPPTITNAIYAGDAGEDDALDINTGVIDSYDSSDPPHQYNPPNHNGSAGSVATDGGITITDTVYGDVYSVRQGGPIDVTGAAVHGDVHGQQRVDLSSGSDVNGSVYADGDVILGSGETVDGDIHTDNETDIDSGVVNGSIYANEGGTISGDSVDGEVHTNGGLVVDGGTFASAVHVNGSFETDGATFEDDVHVEGTVTQIDGTDFQRSLYVDGDVDELSSSGNEPTVDGDVHVTGNATINAVEITGDLHVAGDVTCDSGLVVQGQVRLNDSSAGSSCPSSDGDPNPVQPTESDAPEDTEAPDEPVIDPPAVELPDDSEFDSVPSDCKDGEAIVVDGGRCELDPGKYNVSKLDLDGDNPNSDNLVAETQSNANDTVELYVGGDVSITQDAGIRTGNNGHDNASELEINVYDEDASVDIQSDMTGVVNAPNSTVDVKSGAEVHGAVVADTVNTDGGGGVHYDEALSGNTVGDGQNGTTSIQYLHVTTNEVELEDD